MVNGDNFARVYEAVVAGESAEMLRHVIEECAQGSDERRAQAVNTPKAASENNNDDEAPLETPLQAACWQERGDLVGVLVEAGADVSGIFAGRLTPLAVCIAYGQPESVRALLKAGQDPLEKIRWDPLAGEEDGDDDVFCTAAHFCLKAPRADWPTWNGPLQLSCLEVLLREGGDADVANARDWKGETPIFWVAKQLLDEGDERAALDLLMAAGARTSGIFDSKDCSPLMTAALYRKARVARFLIDEAGAPVDERSPQTGYTALHWCCLVGNAAIAVLLLDAGADMEVRDHFGLTPLLVSMTYGRAAPTQLLLDRGASADLISAGRKTPLIEACRQALWLDDAHWPVFQELLRRSSAETRRAVLYTSSAADEIAQQLAADRASLAGGAASEEQVRVEGRRFWVLGELLASGVFVQTGSMAAVLPIAAAHAARKEADAAARRSELGTGWRAHEGFVRLSLDVRELREAEREVEERRAAVLALELELCELGAGTTDTGSSGSGSSSSGDEEDESESDGESSSGGGKEGESESSGGSDSESEVSSRASSSGEATSSSSTSESERR